MRDSSRRFILATHGNRERNNKASRSEMGKGEYVTPAIIVFLLLSSTPCLQGGLTTGRKLSSISISQLQSNPVALSSWDYQGLSCAEVSHDVSASCRDASASTTDGSEVAPKMGSRSWLRLKRLQGGLDSGTLTPADQEAAPYVMHSWHNCVGHTGTPDGWKYRTCLLRNVCYDGNDDGIFYYYRSQFDHVRAEDMAVSASALCNEHVCDPPVRWQPVVVDGPLPDVGRIIWADDFNRWSTRQQVNSKFGKSLGDWARPKAAEEGSGPEPSLPQGRAEDEQSSKFVAALFVEYNAENFGHILFDQIFPWFRQLEMFSLSSLNVMPLRLQTKRPWMQNCDFLAMLGASSREFCDKLNKKLVDVFTRQQYSVEVLQRKYSRDSLLEAISNLTGTNAQVLLGNKLPLVCFDRLTVGTSMLTDHGLDYSEHGKYLNPKHHDLQNVGHGDTYYRFREAFMVRAGLVPAGVQSSTLFKPTDGIHDVIFLAKVGGRAQWANKSVTKAVALVRERLAATDSQAEVMEGVNLADYSWADQMRLMATTKVVVAMVGGGSLAAVWLPRGATVTLLWDDQRSKLDSALWENLSHVTVHWIRVPSQEADPVEVAGAVEAGLYRYKQYQYLNDQH